VVLAMVVLMIWLMPKLWRAARRFAGRLGSWFTHPASRSD
jgi:hypothetical protein